MRHIIAALLLTCFPITGMASDAFVRVGDGKFSIDGKPYTFIGTNIWYGAILGSEGQARDRYFSYVLSPVDSETGLGGCNFWVWGGLVAPPHPFWQLWTPTRATPHKRSKAFIPCLPQTRPPSPSYAKLHASFSKKSPP